jgi:hypothetical protein
MTRPFGQSLSDAILGFLRSGPVPPLVDGAQGAAIPSGARFVSCLTPSGVLVSNPGVAQKFLRKIKMMPTAPALHVRGQGSGTKNGFLGGING